MKQNFIGIIIIYSFIILSVVYSEGDAVPEPSLLSYLPVHYTTENSLPHFDFGLTLQDKMGYLYFSTRGKGLYSYNGSEWQRYSVQNAGILDDSIISMAYDNENNIYLAHNEFGISAINTLTGKTEVIFSYAAFKADITSLYIDKKKNLYIGTLNRNFFIYNLSSRNLKYVSYPGMPDSSVKDAWQTVMVFLEDSKQRVWAGTDMGIMSIKEGEVDRYYPFEDGKSYTVTWLFEDHQKRLWVSADRFIGILDEKNGLIRQSPSALFNENARRYGSAPFASLLSSTAGEYLYLTSEGILLYNPLTGKTAKLIKEQGQLVSNHLNSAFTDREGNLWVTTKNGVTKFRKTPFTNLNFLENQAVTTANLYSHQRGHLFKESHNGSWLYFDKDNTAFELRGTGYFRYDLSPLMIKTAPPVENIFEDRGNTYFALKDGLYRYGEDGKFQQTPRITLSGYFIQQDGKEYRLYSEGEPDQGIWEKNLQTGRIRLYKIRAHGSPFELHKMSFSFTEQNTMFIIFNEENDYTYSYDLKERIYIKNFFKKLIVKEYNYLEFSIKDIIPGEKEIWISLENPRGKIYHYTPEGIRDLSRILKTEGVIIEDIKTDGKNRLLIATATDGLLIYNNGSLRNYTVEEGLESNRLAGGISLNKEGEIFLLSDTAVTFMDERYLQAPLFNLHFYKIENVTDKTDQINLLTRNGEKKLTLPAHMRNLTFYTAANSFLAEKKYTWQFALNNRNWPAPDSANYITFTDLPPGNHTLNVQLTDHIGRQARQKLTFTIRRYWHEETLFRIFSGVLLLLLMGGIFVVVTKIYTKQLRKKALLLEAKVKERTTQLMKTQKQLIEAAHVAGKAEIVSEIFHNAGNILNFVYVSSDQLLQTLENSKLEGLIKANRLLEKHMDNFKAFFTHDHRAKPLLQYYLHVGQELENEKTVLKENVQKVKSNIGILHQVIQMQEKHAHQAMFTEELNVISLVEDATRFYSSEMVTKCIKFNPGYIENGELLMKTQKSKVLHVLLCLYINAIEAVMENDETNRIITTTINDFPSKVDIIIEDNGPGIDPDNLTKIFNFGFSTKEDRMGFSLHTSANFIQEMKGSLTASNGEKGARFTLSLTKTEQRVRGKE